MKKDKNKISEYIRKLLYKAILFLYVIILVVVYLYNLSNLHQLYVLHDEFGYWANAAHFAGYDWSEIASMSPYYSYGYSFFLVPLLLFFQDSILMYKVAICLNVIFYIGAFFLSIFCAKKIFPKVNLYVTYTICLIISLYCNNLVQVNLTWSEALLYFWFWLIFATMLCYQKEQHWKYGLLLIAELMFLYVIHQRTLGVVIAGICTIIYLLITEKKINIKKVFLLAGVFLAGVFLAALVKNILMENVWIWDNAEVAARNDYSGQLGKLKTAFFTWSGFKNLLSSFGGKTFYLLTASCGILFFGVWKSIIAVVKRGLHSDNAIYIFSVLSLVFTVGISAIFWLGGGRIDGVLYGRYSEFAVGPLLLIGLMYLYEEYPSWLYSGVCIVFTFLCGFLAKRQVIQDNTFTYYQSVGNSLFFNAETGTFEMLQCIAVTMAIALLLFFTAKYKKKLLYTISVTVILIFWFLCSRCVLDKQINYGEKFVKDIDCIAEAIENTYKEEKIYFVYNKEASYFNWRIEHIQFLMPEKKIEKIDISEVKNLTGEYFLIQYGTDYLDLNQYIIVSQGYGMVLMVPEGTELAEKCKVYMSEYPYEFTETMMYSATAEEEFTFEADHVEGFMVFCQDLQLSAGEYEVVMELQADELPEQGVIGFYDMSYNYGEEIQSRGEVTIENIQEDGKVQIVYRFVCEEAVKHAEIRFYSYGNASIKLINLSYRRLN